MSDLTNINLLDSEMQSNFLDFLFKPKEERQSRKEEKRKKKESDYDDYLAERKRRSSIEMDYIAPKGLSGGYDKDKELKKQKIKSKSKIDFSKYADYTTIFDKGKDKDKDVEEVVEQTNESVSKPDGAKEEKFLGMEKKTGIVVASVGGAIILGAMIFVIIKVSK